MRGDECSQISCCLKVNPKLNEAINTIRMRQRE
jgi:hypothetical protein